MVWDLILEMANEHSVPTLLRKVVEVISTIEGVALTRIYLIEPGDICEECPQESICNNWELCLHAEHSAGKPLVDRGEDWTRLEDDPYRRIPLGAYRLGKSAVTRETMLVPRQKRKEWIDNIAWADEEKIEGYLCQPITHRGESLGVLAIFMRLKPQEEGLALSRVIADYLGAAIANARAFAEIEHLKDQLQLEYGYLQEELQLEGRYSDLLGESTALNLIREQIKLVAQTDATVLIQGESGTGKELIAREIHQKSRRKDRPMIKVNLAAIPEDLYESELFGHVRGAFTGAVHDRAGRFQAAEGGTLLLDEIGEIPPHLQVKLLRALQERTIQRVGEEKETTVDVRIIAATNRNLKKEMASGGFREDLYYRLSVFPLVAPPLRERKEDIGILAKRFLEQACQRMHLPMGRLTKAHIKHLEGYNWPGNIRELQNVIEHAAIMTGHYGKLVFHLDDGDGETAPSASQESDAILTDAEMREREKANILAALTRSHGRIRGKGGAAELLDMKPTTLAARMKAMGIKKPETQ